MRRLEAAGVRRLTLIDSLILETTYVKSLAYSVRHTESRTAAASPALSSVTHAASAAVARLSAHRDTRALRRLDTSALSRWPMSYSSATEIVPLLSV